MTSTDPAAAPASLRATEVPWERIEQFIGQLAHDVRNGLNALELQLTFLGEISTDPEAAAEVKLIRKTLSDVTRQLQAVRNSTAAPSLNKLDYPAKDFFEDLQERFERQEAAGKARVQWQIDLGTASLAIDPETTMSAFLELLANALRFGGKETAISMTASANADAASISLVETPSSPPTVALEAWGRSPFLSSRRGAYGIGLFRVRRILESQGGSYHVEYSASGQTLTTRVILPLAGTP